MKLLLIFVSIFVFVGCTSNQVRIRSEIQEVQVPLLYCPAPPNLDQPVLPIHQMTDELKMSDGEIAKHYKATVSVLLGYVDELERALESYDSTNEAYDELREKFQKEWSSEFEDIAPQQ